VSAKAVWTHHDEETGHIWDCHRNAGLLICRSFLLKIHAIQPNGREVRIMKNIEASCTHEWISDRYDVTIITAL
jgi:hypothetical protein